jgi:hypothetical protein
VGTKLEATGFGGTWNDTVLLRDSSHNRLSRVTQIDMLTFGNNTIVCVML